MVVMIAIHSSGVVELADGALSSLLALLVAVHSPLVLVVTFLFFSDVT